MTLQLKLKVAPDSAQAAPAGHSALSGKGVLPAGTYAASGALGLSRDLDALLAPLTQSAGLGGLRVTVPQNGKFTVRSSQGPAALYPSGLSPHNTVFTAQVAACLVGFGLLVLLDTYPAACMGTVGILILRSAWLTQMAPVPEHWPAPLPQPKSDPGAYPLRARPMPLLPPRSAERLPWAPIAEAERLHLRLEMTGPEPLQVTYTGMRGLLGPARIQAVTLRSDRSPMLEGDVRLVGIKVSLAKLTDALEMVVPNLHHLVPLLPPIGISPLGAPMLNLGAGQLQLLPGSALHLTTGNLPAPADAPSEGPGRRLRLNSAGGANHLLLGLVDPTTQASLGEATVRPTFDVARSGSGPLAAMTLGFSSSVQGTALIELIGRGGALLGASGAQVMEELGAGGVEQHACVTADAGVLLAQLLRPVEPLPQ